MKLKFTKHNQQRSSQESISGSYRLNFPGKSYLPIRYFYINDSQNIKKASSASN